MQALMVRRGSVMVVVVALLVVGWMAVSSRASAASATPVVYVATGENFPDALGAASAAAVQGGPVLLVTKTSIPTETRDELLRLKPDVIYVAGGTFVVSDAVVDQLKAYAPTVTRVAGGNRYETAAEVSKSAFPVTASGGGNTTDTTGQGLDHNILQPGLVLNCIIAVSGTFPTDSSTPPSPFIGEIKWFAGNFAPGGYEFCDGQVLQISTNNALFAILGTTYGGNGVTTFALPDARGRVVVHEGNGPGLTARNLGHSFGAETEELTVEQLASHDHGITP